MKSLTARDPGHNNDGNNDGFSIVVPSEPTSSKPSKFNFNKQNGRAKTQPTPHQVPGKGFSNGRKIVDVPLSSKTSATKKNSPEKSELSCRERGKKQNANADDVDKLLENDAAALLSMRKDIQIAQSKEMEKARAHLASLQKESNSLKTNCDLLSKQYAEVVDTQTTLQKYIKDGEEKVSACHRVMDGINENLRAVEDDMKAEERTRDMMAFMKHRLEHEIFAIKSSNHELSQTLEQTRSEFAGADNAMRITRVELATEEKHVETLQKTVKERSEQREIKMQQLQSIVNEGEFSVAKVQENMEKPSPRAKDTKVAWNVNEVAESQPSPSKPTYRKQDSAWTITDDDSDHNVLNVSVNLTKEKIDEVVDWYRSKESRIDELKQVQDDLKDSISKEKTRKLQIESLLERSRHKVLLLASNRQMYQEVDMKDAALTSARKEGDEFKEKDYRLRKNIESLRRSIPRFLQKITDGGLSTSDAKPVPVDQLPDVVHKLEDEIVRLIKQIGEKMLKDATQEDLANMSSSIQEFSTSNENNGASETSRLHKLPGYNRLQKQLFLNLMSAPPDTSSANVRVKTQNRYVDDVVYFPGKDSNDVVVSSGGTRRVNNEGVLDRDVVKKLSSLVSKRENPPKPASSTKIHRR